MVRVKTSSGFECELDEKNLNDMELVEAIVEAHEGKLLVIPKIIKKLLGEKAKKALYDFCREKETGRVPLDKVSTELTEIIKGVNKGKNF